MGVSRWESGGEGARMRGDVMGMHGGPFLFFELRDGTVGCMSS